MMPGVNYVIYGCPSVRTTPEVSQYRSFLTLEKNIITVTTQNREIDDNLERQINFVYLQIIPINLNFSIH